jgi:uncharacterized protein YjbI with pentapeptide repeats
METRYKLLAAAIAFVPLSIFHFDAVRAQEADLRELYNLCSRFPYNAQCEGLDIPVPLDERTGIETYCWLDPGSWEAFNKCKFTMTGDRLTVYVEEGEPVQLLNDRRGTQELIIPYESIWASHSWLWNYRGGRSILSGLNEYTLMSAEDEAFSEVTAEFAEDPNSNERIEAGEDFSEVMILFASPSAPNAGNRSQILRILATDEFGAFLQQQLVVNEPEPRLSSITDQVFDPAATELPTDVSEQINQLLETRVCIRCDLRGADLENANLDNANLEGTNLQGANLTSAELNGAYLVGADLSGANLTDADLDSAKLTGATLVGATLQDARIRNTLLQGANFQDANLSGADLSGLTAAQLANFSNANLQNANLVGANLVGASFENANLETASLKRSPLQRAGDYRFIGGLFFIETNLSNVDLSTANLNGAELQRVIFENANLSNAILTEADLDNADFSGANLNNADLTGADLDDVNFSRANLQGIIPVDVDLSNTNLCNATLLDGSVSEAGEECD